MKKSLVFCAAFMAALPAGASQDRTDDAMIVFDGSGSMAEMGFNDLDAPRIVGARAALHRAIPPIARSRRLGLTIYGPGDRENRCGNIFQVFGPIANAAQRILATLDALRPAGPTPLTEAVAQAADALGYRDRPATVLLVTDGKETCSGATCQLARHLAREGFDLTVHVIGFKLRAEHFDWNAGLDIGVETVAACLADETGGEYIAVETVDELVTAMTRTLGCPVYGELAR